MSFRRNRAEPAHAVELCSASSGSVPHRHLLSRGQPIATRSLKSGAGITDGCSKSAGVPIAALVSEGLSGVLWPRSRSRRTSMPSRARAMRTPSDLREWGFSELP